MGLLSDLQALLVGSVLVWAAYGKLLSRRAPVRARRAALSRFVGERRALPAYRAVGGLELAVGATLLLPPVWRVDAPTATALAAGFVGYLGYARVAAPDSACGCVGSTAVPVTMRSLVRAGLILAVSAAIFAADGSWPSALADRPVAAAAIIGVEAAAFVALSPELDRWWLVPLRRWWVRMTHPLAGTADTNEVPLLASEQQLLRSGAYHAVAGLLRSDIREHWDEGAWRFVCYQAAYGDDPATAVFAVPLRRYDPDAVRVAVVDEASGHTLYRPELTPT